MASSSSPSSLSSMSSSSSAAMSSTSAAASSSPAPAPAAPAPAPAPPVPGLLDDTAFPPLGTEPPRPPRSGIAAGPTTSAERRSGRDTIIAIGLPLSLYGRRGLAAAGTAATPEELDAAAETAATNEERESETAATDEEREAETAATAEELDSAAETAATDEEREAGDTAPGTSSTAATISARPPICASPGSLAEAAALLSGAPTLLPAAQAFGGYRFGTTFGDFFQDLRRAAAAAAPPPPPPPPPPPHYLSLVPLQGPPPLQAPRYPNLAPRDLVPLQGPPPQFAPPGLAHYASAMQFAARPQHMRFHVSAPGRPALFIDVQWRYEVTPPHLPHHPQGALQLYGHPPVPPVGHVGSTCWDCQFRQAALPFPCGHVFLCRHCHARRFACPCCDGVVPPPGVPF
ncbi:uncharacterized protein [Aegilops tauschii subsp. strangulata]|uniref:uncharacterized protein n=1 Tax=Aegilops tauschii subsp. strangulata TaxID=200361 RepID=UPI003CC86507